MPIITLSRELGSRGDDIAVAVAERLKLKLVGRELINRAARQAGAPEVALAEIDELGLLGVKPSTQALQLYRVTVEGIIRELAEAGDVLLVGRGGQIVLRGWPRALHVRVIAPRAQRILLVQECCGVSPQVAAARVDATDRARAGYLRRNYGIQAESPELYALILNMAYLPVEAAVEMICIAAVRIGAADRDAAGGVPIMSQVYPTFSHPVEAEFARILDFYGIPWQYEPRTFALTFDGDGNITEAFTPDFYLPDQDLYVELTTMQPRQVRHKNHKLRRLQELHPDINIKLFKRGDIRDLMIKFGVDDYPDMMTNRL